MQFELNNDQRKYLGLELVSKDWEKVILKGDSYRPDSILYFDKNIIRKQIISSDIKYSETQYFEETNDKKLLLPKTNRGKPKKLTSATLETKTPIGVYFSFDPNGITIGNHSTQNTFYSTRFEEIKFKNIEDLKVWLEEWIANSSNEDLKQIQDFSNKKRKRVKLENGDFFRFKVDRRNYGFGRLIYDLRTLRKDQKFKSNKNYGIMNLMAQPLVIKVYHTISSTKEVDIDKIKKSEAFPSQYIMDNSLFYGDFEVLENQELEKSEYDFPISYSKSIHFDNFDKVYLQYGMIYKETSIKKFNKYLTREKSESNKEEGNNLLNIYPFRMESIGYDLNISKEILENSIRLNSNDPYWESNHYNIESDLRNPKNKKPKKEIFEHFGLDPTGTYYENLNK
ncbi:hypothetical protein G3I01_15860 [Gramella sp. MT6]|uniref:immunity 26/phosphotriesterase HocA family protein n=1 Tax=Gramella sp. MT6 TaxID=2705471 RepID=UPI001C6061CB|nr:immunity 26/phosphotriesterase HocA family protein [Gramella sp. MT6]QYA26909.1 hypothetical protein G3I01_15860 [Gramella sp. MT6]